MLEGVSEIRRVEGAVLHLENNPVQKRRRQGRRAIDVGRGKGGKRSLPLFQSFNHSVEPGYLRNDSSLRPRILNAKFRWIVAEWELGANVKPSCYNFRAIQNRRLDQEGSR